MYKTPTRGENWINFPREYCIVQYLVLTLPHTWIVFF